MSPSSEIDARNRTVGARNGALRLLYLLTGFLFVGLAGLGAVLPVLPTTPLLLVAAACFARSSERFYGALLGNKMFGPLIRDWRDHGIIPLKAKVWAVSLIAIAGGFSVASLSNPWAKLGLGLALLGLIGWFLQLPSARSSQINQERS